MVILPVAPVITAWFALPGPWATSTLPSTSVFISPVAALIAAATAATDGYPVSLLIFCEYVADVTSCVSCLPAKPVVKDSWVAYVSAAVSASNLASTAVPNASISPSATSTRPPKFVTDVSTVPILSSTY